MTKEKALYQVKLILDNLEEEDYKLLRKEDIDYVNNNMEYDESISLDPSVPFENLDLDPLVYGILDKIFANAESNKSQFEKKKLEDESSKDNEIKEMILEYKSLLEKKDEIIKSLNENNAQLYNSIQKCPFFIRKIFFKDFEKKLLK